MHQLIEIIIKVQINYYIYHKHILCKIQIIHPLIDNYVNVKIINIIIAIIYTF